MKYLIPITFIFFISIAFSQENRDANFPSIREKVAKLPAKEKVWVFILAGQSNMAGRGFVEPMDTIPNNRIIALNNNKEWVYAKEPLHFYEPNLTGLDCGLSFAKKLLECVPDDVTIALIPCAVGGSSISQWINDEVYRDVKLLTNFTERVKSVENDVVFKGVLWHQGESDANDRSIPKYEERTEALFQKFREITNNKSLPILVGELGAFIQPEEAQKTYDSINAIIHKTAMLDANRFVISTKELTHKGDNLHFDSKSQRDMGVRFAKAFLKEVVEINCED